jgi:hypothetical protein
MITTNTFLIGTWVMVGDGVGEGDEAVDADCTPPQPTIRARRGTLKKAYRTRLKALAPHESLRESRAV